MSEAGSDPHEAKVRIQSAYSKAVANRSMSRSRSGSGIDHLLRDVRLYGREAGIDFVETHHEALIQEAVECAECKDASLTIQVHRCGRSAVSGMASRLEELTNLRVESTANTVKITWADTTPNLV